MPNLKKLIAIGAACSVAAFVGLQLFPAGKIGVHVEDIGTNPPERFDIGAPPDVEAILRRACFDCHTNETKWPLYARLAPGSWLMARDVHNGRTHLNLSNWADADEDERQTDKENAWEQIESGDMPPWFYVYPLHLRAKLSEADKATLKGWLMKDAGKAKTKATDDDKGEAQAKDDDKGDKDDKGAKDVSPTKDGDKGKGAPMAAGTPAEATKPAEPAKPGASTKAKHAKR